MSTNEPKKRARGDADGEVPCTLCGGNYGFTTGVLPLWNLCPDCGKKADAASAEVEGYFDRTAWVRSQQ